MNGKSTLPGELSHPSTRSVVHWECWPHWVSSHADIKGLLHTTRLFHLRMAVQHQHKLLLHQPQGYFRKLSSRVQQCRHRGTKLPKESCRAAGQVATVPSLFSVIHALPKAGRSAWWSPYPLSAWLPGATTFVFFLQPLCFSPSDVPPPPTSAYHGHSLRSLVVVFVHIICKSTGYTLSHSTTHTQPPAWVAAHHRLL